MRVQFDLELDRFQALQGSEWAELASPGLRLASLGVERVRREGRVRTVLDAVFVGASGARLPVLLIERNGGALPSYVFPQSLLQEVGTAIAEQLAEWIEEALGLHARPLEELQGRLEFCPEGPDPGGPGDPGRVPSAEWVCSVERREFRERLAGSIGPQLLLHVEGDAASLGDLRAFLELAGERLGPTGAVLVALRCPPAEDPANPGPTGPQLTREHLLALMTDRFDEVDRYRQGGAGSDLEACRVAAGWDSNASWCLVHGRRPRLVRPAPRVSIVIPVFNQVHYTLACIEAIERHGPAEGVSHEILVVDNGSSDATAESLATMAARRGSRIYVRRNGENLGFARACNVGALLARGEIVVFLNNDTEVHPGWLRALVDELDTNPEAAAVGSRLLYPDGTVQHAGVVIGRDQVPYHLHAGLPADDPKVISRRLFRIVTGACLAVRRGEFLDVGLFDEAFVNGHEDIDLCLRWSVQGRQIVYRPDSVVTHHESGTEGRMRHREHNLRRTFRKWRNDLVQDDFAYRFPADERGRPERPLSFAIKIGPPDRSHAAWGDIYYAECLAKSLCRQGHTCRIHYLDEWGKDDRDVDVVIHLKGLSRYWPKPHNVNVLWMLNHPDRHGVDELSRYDAVLVASEIHAERLRPILPVPVIALAQATDPEHFRPLPHAASDFDIVFVGNNVGAGRAAQRKIVADLFPTPHRVGVWGSGWGGLLPEGVWQGPFVPWERLPEVYAGAKIVLNDHQPEMKENGFVNNRTFDAAACGTTVISDAVEGIEDVLPVRTYRSARKLHAQIERILTNPDEARVDAEVLRRRVLQSFTFDARASSIVEIASNLGHAWRRVEAFRAGRGLIEVAARPLVSVLMSTHDRRRFLPAALESVRRQRYANWELILANDGGPRVDDLVEALGDPRIRLIELEGRRGKSFAVNRAFQISRGAIIAYLDDDDIWYPPHLERLLDPLTRIAGIEMAYSDAWNVFQDPDGRGGFVETRRELLHHHQVGVGDLLERNRIQGIVVAHTRRLFTEVGGLDERLEALIDWDLWRRLAGRTDPYHVSEVTAEHYLRNTVATTGHGHITSLHVADPVRYAVSAYRVARKNPRPGDAEIEAALLGIRRRFRAELQLALGERSQRDADPARARMFFLLATRSCPEAHLPWTRLGVLALHEARPEEALAHFRNAIERRTPDARVYLFAALAALGSGRAGVSLALLDALEEDHPEAAGKLAAEIAEYRRRARGDVGIPSPAATSAREAPDPRRSEAGRGTTGPTTSWQGPCSEG